MDAGSRSPRAGGARPDGQHFLRSRLIAAEIVRGADIGPNDHVLEIGAGTGRLTHPLAERAAHVSAVELDPVLAERLRRSFEGHRHVRIVLGDVLRVPLPDAPSTGPERADLLIQFEAARKRAAVHPATLLTLGWQPWWDFTLARRVPRFGFEPPPHVDAGLLVITRRPFLMHPDQRSQYTSLLRIAFDHASTPVRRSLHDRLAPMRWKRLARERGLRIDARPTDLDVWDWVAVFMACP